jgi:hypothetical protein
MASPTPRRVGRLDPLREKRKKNVILAVAGSINDWRPVFRYQVDPIAATHEDRLEVLARTIAWLSNLHQEACRQ